MTDKPYNASEPSAQREEGTSKYFIVEYLNSLIIGFGRFLKSSYLSITFIVIILLLVQSLDQANTLLVDMIERDKFSLVLCFLVIAFFAAVLSHYPLYIFYSKDLNKSKNNHVWYAYKLWFNYYIFNYKALEKTYADKDYDQDYKAKFFRQLLGLIIYSIWHYYIYQTFYPKLNESLATMQTTNIITIGLVVIPVIALIVLLHRLYLYQTKKRVAKLDGNQPLYDEIKSKRKSFTNKGALALLVVLGTVIVMTIVTLSLLRFNMQGYWLLQIMTFLLAMLYVLFRIFRVYLIAYNFKWYHFSNHVAFLRFYLVVFIALIIHLIYANLAVYYNLAMANAMFILLSCFFIIYYILACSLKYYFVLGVFKDQKDDLLHPRDGEPKITPKAYLYKSIVINKKNRVNLLPLERQKAFANRRRRWASLLTIGFIILCFISMNIETKVHELELFNAEEEVCTTLDDEKDAVTMTAFKSQLLTHVPEGENIVFVAAHGGGLKANIWTMKVLNDLQIKSQGQFFKQSASLSGASGGMMGLSMYSVLSGVYPKDYKRIAMEIDSVACENFASRDIAMTFGYDFIRKLAPFHTLGNYRDRSYYAMVRYRNVLVDRNDKTLTTEGYKKYWKHNIYNTNDQFFPSLIVNTAKTSGKRGVFYSLAYDDQIFSNSDKLSQINDGEIAFYEAVSSTNRFPALSPAAKIKGYGHYIDAGAIDNSGLLSSLDLYTYLEKDSLFQKRKKVFVEILNGRSSYIAHLIREFKKQATNTNYTRHILIDEIEQDNIVADIKTGLNLDKIPNYLNDLLQGWEANENIMYLPIYLPFHIDIEDVENYIGGAIICEELRDDLNLFLQSKNQQLKIDLKDNDPEVWLTYEPTLARHLSKSTIAYYDNVINGELMKAQIEEVLKVLQ